MEIDKNNLIQKMSHMLHWSDPVIYSKHVPAMRRSGADTAEHKKDNELKGKTNASRKCRSV